MAQFLGCQIFPQRVFFLMPGINGITASAERKIAVHCKRNVLKERHQPAASGAWRSQPAATATVAVSAK